jgi:cysteine sulfinate desulfinase/cysteine desulfurase-like protein
MQLEEKRARSAIRITFGRTSSDEDIPYIAQTLKETIEKMSSS